MATLFEKLRVHDRKISALVEQIQRIFNDVNSNPEKPERPYHVEVVPVEVTHEHKIFLNGIVNLIGPPSVRAELEPEFITV